MSRSAGDFICQGREKDEPQNPEADPTLAINCPTTLNPDQAEKKISHVKKYLRKLQPNGNFKSHLPSVLGKRSINVRVRFLTWRTSPVLKHCSFHVSRPETLMNCGYESQKYEQDGQLPLKEEFLF